MFGLRAAIAMSIALAALPTAAYAQDDLTRGGAAEYQVQRERSQAADDIFAGDEARVPPRFIVEAISFKAVNERNLPLLSNDVFAYFWMEDASLATQTFEDVDRGDTVAFPSTQNCIWPAIDPDGRANESWACDPQGRAGTIQFAVSIVAAAERSRVQSAFCAALRPGDLGRCAKFTGGGQRFDVEFRYRTAELMPLIDPACNCFTRTTHQQLNSEITYDFTFRITMVDPGSGPEVLAPPEAGRAPPQAVHQRGALSANLGQQFDFDANAVVGSGGDLIFTSENLAYWLQPTNGARVWLSDGSRQGYDGCRAGISNYTRTRLHLPAAGQHVCYLTSDGRLGELRLRGLSRTTVGNPPRLGLTYVTWR